MSITPTGNFALTLSNLASMFANSTNFQAWVDAPDATTAMNNIHVGGLYANPEQGGFIRPYVIIWMDNVSYNIKSGAFGTGDLKVMFEENVSCGEGASHADALYQFLNDTEPILNDVMVASYQPGNLMIRELTADTPPLRSNNVELGNYMQQTFSVAYGAEV